MADDPEFTERAAEVLGGYPVLADDSIADSVAQAYDVSDETRQYVVDLLHDAYDISVH